MFTACAGRTEPSEIRSELSMMCPRLKKQFRDSSLYVLKFWPSFSQSGIAGSAHRLDFFPPFPSFAFNVRRMVIKTILKILSLLPKGMKFIKIARR